MKTVRFSLGLSVLFLSGSLRAQDAPASPPSPLATASAPLPSTPALTLEQAIAQVVARYPSIERAQAAIESAEARTLQTLADRLPQVNLSGSYEYTAPRAYVDFDLPSGPSRLYQTVHDNYNVGLNVRQLITDFGRTRAALSLARSGEITAQDALEQVRQQLGYQAIQSFYAVILLRQSVSVAEEEIRSLNEALRITEQKFSGGRATKFDVLTTRVRIANAENRRTDTIAALRKQEASLRQLLGYPVEAPLVLAGDFEETRSRPDLSMTLSTGLLSRPEMRLARDAEKTAQLRLDVADRTDRPTVSAEVTGAVRNGFPPALYDRTDYLAGGISVAVPIFNGHRTQGKRLEARADLRSAEARTKETIRSITTEVENAFADLTASEARLANADALVAQAEEALELAKTRATNGVITNFELLDAQSSARAAELTRVQARYDYVLARQAVARAAGQPPKA